MYICCIHIQIHITYIYMIDVSSDYICIYIYTYIDTGRYICVIYVYCFLYAAASDDVVRYLARSVGRFGRQFKGEKLLFPAAKNQISIVHTCSLAPPGVWIERRRPQFTRNKLLKSDSATSPDCATRMAQLFGRIAQLRLRNLACPTPRIAQLRLRNFQDCATLFAQVVGMRSSACATAFDRLRNSQDCATLLVQLRWTDCTALQLHFLQTIPAPIELENGTCRPQEQDVITIPTPRNFKLTWSVHKVKTISKFPPRWNFKLTWSVHKVKMISEFPPPWNVKLTWSLHKVKMISKFPPPWNFKLTWSVHKVINVGLWNLDVAFWDLRLCLWNLEFHCFLICLQSFAVPVKQSPPKVSPSLCRLSQYQFRNPSP